MLLESIKSICHDPPALLAFAGVVAAVIVLTCLLLMLLRSRELARRAAATTRDLIADMKSLREQFDETEQRLDKRIDGVAGDVETQVAGRLEEKAAALDERLAANRKELDEALARLEASAASVREDLNGLGRRLEELEGRVPGLLEQLEEFRETLSRTFQDELSGVLSSFDSSVSGILEQMKSELQIGISRIEGIEEMVRGRERAEQALLAGAGEEELVAGDGGESDRFAEWEQEAKVLAESDEEDEPAEDDAAEPQTPEAEDEAQDHPGEMSAYEDEETDGPLESALYDEEEDDPQAT